MLSPSLCHMSNYSNIQCNWVFYASFPSSLVRMNSASSLCLHLPRCFLKDLTVKHKHLLRLINGSGRQCGNQCGLGNMRNEEDNDEPIYCVSGDLFGWKYIKNIWLLKARITNNVVTINKTAKHFPSFICLVF